jgi:hypothetical protein
MYDWRNQRRNLRQALRLVCGVAVCGGLVVVSRADEPPVRPTATAQAAPLAEHPLRPAIRVAQTCLDQLQGVQDYECILTKRELINEKLVTQVMFMRLREQPFSVYCKFGEPAPGREVLYVAGRNNDMLLAHEGSGIRSLVGTVSLPLDSPEVTAENRHPITRAGLRNLLTLLIKQWDVETQFGEINVQYYPDARLGDISCHVLESSHPRPRRQFLHHLTRLYIDTRSGVPVRIENYGWPAQAGGRPVLVEEYTYTKLRLNVGLTDHHFDRACPDYNF